MRKLLIPLLLCFSLSAFAADNTDKGPPVVKMRDGGTMEAKDGTMFMMKNNAILKKITEHSTLNPKVP